jgi:hypothetical protein
LIPPVARHWALPAITNWAICPKNGSLERAIGRANGAAPK